MCKIDSCSLVTQNHYATLSTSKMNNNTTTGVNISNLILTNTGPSGFSNYDAISEFADNSADGGARKIKMKFDDMSATIYFADNGSGMERESLPECYTLYKHVARDDSQTNGIFGIGSKAGLIKLTMAKHPTTIYTKTKGVASELTEMKLDWAKTVATGVYERSPHDITKKGEAIWDTYGPGSHGTLLQIPCDDKVYNELKSNIPKICADFGSKYYMSIDDGLCINIIDGAGNESKVKSNNPIGSVADASHIGENKIEVYKVKADGSLRYYYKNGYKKSVYIDVNGKETQHDPSTEPDFYERMEGWNISINSGYSEDFGEENSGYYFMRGCKIIDRFSKPFPGSGDFGLRAIVGHSRHVIQFPPRMDALMKIELNKSRIKEADLPGTLRKSIDATATKFAKSLYNKSYKKTKEQAEVPIQNMQPVPTPVRQATVSTSPAPTIARPTPAPTVVPPPPLARPTPAPTAVPPPLARPTPAPTVVPPPLARLAPVPAAVPPPPLTRPDVVAAPPVITRLSIPPPVVVEPVAARPRPPVHYEIQFDISSSKELIITDTRTDGRLATLPTDGNGAAIREVLISRLLKLADREKFLKECLPLMEKLMNV